MGQIITFYSYKGGVGRSSALANAAILLARWGYKTLIIDWDLEAPGLEFFYKEFFDVRLVSSTGGVVDLLTNQSQRHTRVDEAVTWMDLIVDVKLPQESGPLRMLKAGSLDDGYFEKLRKFDVENFYKRKQGGLFIEELRNQWKDAFDFVLVDSRTGITDIGGICTVQLPDILILFFTANDQAFQGAIDVAIKAQQARQNLPIDRLKLLCVPIASKFDSDKEFRLSQQYLSEFALQLSDAYADWLPKEISPSVFLQATKVPYIPYFSFGSKLAVIDQGLIDPSGLGYSYETLAALIANNLEYADEVVSDRSQFVRRAMKSTEYAGPIFHSIKPPFGNSDKEFQLRVEQNIASQNDGEFNVLLEKLRDQTVGLWRSRLLSKTEVDNQALKHLKTSEFLPAMRALTLLGLMIVKYRGSEAWFEGLVDVLIDVFEIGAEVRRKLPLGGQSAKPKTLDTHDTATVPGLEALITANLLGCYDLTKNKSVTYFSKLFPRVVKFSSGVYDEQFSTFFLFWPYFYWSPNVFIDSLVSERYANGSVVEDFFSTPEALKISVLQANCLLEWHSFLGFSRTDEASRAGEPETVKFFKDKYPSATTNFHPSFFHEPPTLLTPLIVRLWEALTRSSSSFLSLDPELDTVLAGIDVERRKLLFARFLISVQKQHEQWMFQQSRHPFFVDWPREIQEVVSQVQNAQ
jgi:MinD-like ATPase involved in chromosome partitioning or flagellar assembly